MGQAKNHIKLQINGIWRELAVAPDRTLVKTLREDLGLTGTKVNCEQGECGACTVLLDGKAVNSCLVLTSTLDGRSVVTIEGLSRQETPDPLLDAFEQADASQCGFCTPGMVMASKGLLLKNPNPRDDEIRNALAGNYCRCTGYKSIIHAVRTASEIMRKRDKQAGNGGVR